MALFVGWKASSHMRAESFFHMLKYEADGRFAGRNEAKKWLFYYIEAVYNRHRIHSSIDWCTPQEYENIYWKERNEYAG